MAGSRSAVITAGRDLVPPPSFLSMEALAVGITIKAETGEEENEPVVVHTYSSWKQPERRRACKDLKG